MSFDLTILVALGFVGLLAGFVDAIAGGGGLIALPVLLSVGIPPVTAFGTNKLQSVVGTAIAAFTYWRKGFVSLQLLALAIPLTFIGSFLGALAVKSIDTTVLQYAVPVALIAVAVYFAFAPKLTDEDSQARLSTVIFVPVMGFAIGFYDGILGPGTGSFLTLGFVTLFGLGVTRAAGHTKVLNLTSNIGALALFIPSGNVVLPVAIAMIIGQIVGGYLGALTGIRFGARLIRPLVVLVSIALAIKLLLFP
ncbi:MULTISPECIES: TSUP family transporter [unclassified Devosia]|mgnify:CR=1 FL=1|uniref:TSUP family transporter n=1 Tax=unclassified Devosia TaxID=196773 RepID=UPI000A4355DE|nr:MULTISPECIES: TSUP family transporter [unclassified Devosia]MBN9360565.1 TSUP family transporter [Devosia sp.]